MKRKRSISPSDSTSPEKSDIKDNSGEVEESIQVMWEHKHKETIVAAELHEECEEKLQIIHEDIVNLESILREYKTLCDNSKSDFIQHNGWIFCGKTSMGGKLSKKMNFEKNEFML